MGYTWTDGELITATKLNNTGGSGYDAVIRLTHASDSSDDSYTNLTPSIESGTYADLYAKCNDNGVPNICVEYYHPWGYRSTLVGCITYINNLGLTIFPVGYYPLDLTFRVSQYPLLWGNSDSIAWDD